MPTDCEVVPSRTATLFELVDTLSGLFDCLETAETQEETEAAHAEIERVVSTELRSKVDGICWFDKGADDEIEHLKGIRDDIQRRIVQWQNRKEQVRDMVRCAMQRLMTDRLEGSIYKITLREGAESVDITDAGQLPAQYCRVIPQRVEPDKVRIKESLKAGNEVPGARLVRGEQIIQIR